MSDELKGAIITAIVTGIISIIGFVVIYNSMKKNFKNELEKEKTRACLKTSNRLRIFFVATLCGRLERV